MLHAITTGAPARKKPGAAAAAVTLRAVLPSTGSTLTSGERLLLEELLDRLAAVG